MKNYLYLLLGIAFFIACEKDETTTCECEETETEEQQEIVVDFGYGYDGEYIYGTDASQNIPKAATKKWYLNSSYQGDLNTFSNAYIEDGTYSITLTITYDNITNGLTKQLKIQDNVLISEDYPEDTTGYNKPSIDFVYSLVYDTDSSLIDVEFTDNSNTKMLRDIEHLWYVKDNKLSGTSYTIRENGHYAFVHKVISNGNTYSVAKEVDIVDLK